VCPLSEQDPSDRAVVRLGSAGDFGDQAAVGDQDDRAVRTAEPGDESPPAPAHVGQGLTAGKRLVVGQGAGHRHGLGAVPALPDP
jgi:hypothetical protein